MTIIDLNSVFNPDSLSKGYLVMYSDLAPYKDEYVNIDGLTFRVDEVIDITTEMDEEEGLSFSKVYFQPIN